MKENTKRDGDPAFANAPADQYREEIARLSAENAALRLSNSRHSTAEARLSLALDATGFGVWDWDMVSGDVWMSDSALAVQGFIKGDVRTHTLGAKDYFHPDDWPRWEKLLSSCAKGTSEMVADEHRMRHKNGNWIWMLERARVVERDKDGRALRMIGTRADMTERRKSEERIRWLALHDPLTGLPNRALFHDMLTAGLVRAEEGEGECGLLFIDIDNFKKINDSYGHEEGDNVLCGIAEHLRNLFAAPATVARIGGDEFGVVIPNIADASMLRALATSALREADGKQVCFSVGGAIYPTHADDIRTLRRRADAALYQAKAEGRCRAVVHAG
ncbi:MAG: sensor domain-containing diguanylate cyclase [Pacificimonas sp.]